MTYAKAELDNLLNDAIEMAVGLIEKHGNHIPFAMVITVSGERINIAADNTETQNVQELIAGVRNHLRETCSPPWKYRAVAFADNVEYRSAIDGKRTDAIRVTLDHLRKEGATCYLPYEFINGEVKPGELFAVEAEERFFTIEK